MNTLLQVDNFLTKLIFGLPHNVVVDSFFQFMSALGNWAFLWIAIIVYLTIIEERKNRIFTLFFFLTVIAAVLLSNTILKNIFLRPRPLSPPISTDYPSDFSFPSGHATVAFAAAPVLAFFEKKRRAIFYTIAFLIAFSRVYLGYHYVGDVVAGAIIGSSISTIMVKLYILSFPRSHA